MNNCKVFEQIIDQSDYCSVCDFDCGTINFYDGIGGSIGRILAEMERHYRNINEIQFLVDLRITLQPERCTMRLRQEKQMITMLERELQYRCKPPEASGNGIKLTKALIDTIKQQINTIEVMSQYVEIWKMKGCREYTFRCPLHGDGLDKTPAGRYDDDKKQFYCHVCNRGGDIFDFLSAYGNKPFFDAVAELGRLVGYTLSKACGGVN